jgi:Ca2+-binding RTX toxin-like protein
MAATTSNLIEGTSYDDRLCGGATDNVISGYEGDDTIVGGSGDDVIDGGSGDDWIFAKDGGNTLYGGDGNDRIYAGKGNTYIDGGAGADFIAAGSGDNIIFGGDGDDTLSGAGQLDGGAGNDTFFAIWGDNNVVRNRIIKGGAGVDTSVYLSPKSSYAITANADGSLKVSGGKSGLSHGTDILYDVEFLQFADVTVPTSSFFPKAAQSLSLSGGKVNEDAPGGTVVGTLSASDAGKSGTLAFKLLDDAGGQFAIANGVDLVVAPGARIDYESGGALRTVVVGAVDSVGHVLHKSFAIRVIDVAEPPSSLTLSGGVVAENAAAGAVVGTLIGVDADHGDKLSYALTDNAGGAFALSGAKIVLAPGATLNYAAAKSYAITAAVTDSHGLSLTETFTINVAHVNQAPHDLTLSAAVVDSTATAGTVVGVLRATDPDPSDTLSYSLLKDASGVFQVVGNKLVVAPGAAFDHLSQSVLPVTVQAKDAGGLTCTANLSVNLRNLKHFITGTAASEVVNGTSGADTICAMGGKDTIHGLAGNDLIYGETGNDSIDGGPGNDTIVGGGGRDTLSGGSGADTFVFKAGFGKDVITDFDVVSKRHDTLEFDKLSFSAITRVGADVLITVDAADTILLKKVKLADLLAHHEDFHFL